MKRNMMKLFLLMTPMTMMISVAKASDVSRSMTYRDNKVQVTGASGIIIDSGSFTVNDFSITSGQDPEGRNYVGQVHDLENGEFVFEVGRSGSASVADWFNTRFSGYNNPSVNGDRTTFDHTAGSLNFAFEGDLKLRVTTPDYPNGITVTFPDAAFAQGKSGARNNWWFAQKSGQHTRDSDGPDTILAIGNTADQKTVYASFLRGGNGVSEVCLQSLCVPEPARQTSYKLENVEEKFHSLPVNGTLSSLSGFPGSYDPTINHIQGYSLYDNQDDRAYALLTHSVSTASYAHIAGGPIGENEKWGFKTYLEGWKHPGGIQVIGDYLLVPSEHETSSHVALYDLRTLKVKELRRIEPFDLFAEHKAGSLGITSYTDADGVEYYVMIVAHLNNENSVYHVYRAPAADGIENAQFTEVGAFPYEKDFQGFGLVTESETNNIYMIGLWSPSEGATFADYAYLYKLNTTTWSIGEELDSIHMVSTGGAPGIFGVHFRYGAGVYVNENGELTLSATERNTVLGSALATNNWNTESSNR